MQTFVPYPNFKRSAQVLDRQRLGKQRVETLQILNALAGLSKGWTNHPATLMWRGHELALACYGVAICKEWKARGYKDSCHQKIVTLAKNTWATDSDSVEMPVWWGDSAVHDSHKSKLLQKDFGWYSQFNWDVPTNLDYVWRVAK